MKGTSRLPAAARAIVDGDRRVLARMITAVENGDPSADPVVRSLYARSGRAPVVGLTGPLDCRKHRPWSEPREEARCAICDSHES